MDPPTFAQLLFGMSSGGAPTFVQDLPYIPDIHRVASPQSQPNFLCSEQRISYPNRVDSNSNCRAVIDPPLHSLVNMISFCGTNTTLAEQITGSS